MIPIIDLVTIEGLIRLVKENSYKIKAHLKISNKQVNESVVNKDDFLAVLKQIDGKGISDETQSMITPLLQVNSNHSNIFKVKFLTKLLKEIDSRRDPANRPAQNN